MTTAFNDAAMIVQASKLSVEVDAVVGERALLIASDLARAAQLIKDAEEHGARLLELYQRQERTIEEQRVVSLQLERALTQAQTELRGEIKERNEAEREITRLRKKNDTLVERLEAHGKMTHDLVGIAAQIHNGTHELLRDAIGFIRPLGATSVTETAGA
jgi:hypothetical protein